MNPAGPFLAKTLQDLLQDVADEAPDAQGRTAHLCPGEGGGPSVDMSAHYCAKQPQVLALICLTSMLWRQYDSS